MLLGFLTERLAWPGPLLSSPDEREHRVSMARAAIYLYAASSVLGLASLAVPDVPGRNAGAIALAALGAFVVAGGHLAAFDRLPIWLFQASGCCATALTTVALYFGGQAAGAYTVFYVWPVLYAFFFYRPAGAALQLGLVGAGFALVLALPGASNVRPVHAIVTLGTLAVAGIIILMLKVRLVGLVGGLRAAEARYRTLVEHLPLATYIDALDGKTSYISPQIEPMLGYPARLWLDTPEFFADLIHPDDRDRVLAEVADWRESGRPFRSEYRLLAGDGRPVWVLDETVLVRDEDGRSMFRHGFFLDVTAQKEAEHEQARLEEELRQSQKMESVGRLAGGVAHDFNNLLMAISGYGDLALARLGPDAGALRANLEGIKQAAERATSLTRQLLAFSRKQILQPKVLDLNGVVAGMDGLLRRLIGEDVEVVTVFDPAVGRVEADPGQLEQVLVNLAINARDAMPGGGTLTIETASAPPGRVLLSVSDTGSGIDPETKKRIFEPFFTTKDMGKGTGLGLSTVYGIVAQSGGSIEVESTPGAGATFRVYLPVVEQAPEQGDGADGGAEGGSGTILLVEDEDIVRNLIIEILERYGYTVLAAAGPEQGLEIGERYGASIDLLLTDVVMPKMSGRELAQRLLAARPSARLIYMSGYTDGALLEHGVLADGTMFLQKPFSSEELARKVREVLEAPDTVAQSA
ncbi:MAG: ATP-binding protein [Gaiellaceae bacterium]